MVTHNNHNFCHSLSVECKREPDLLTNDRPLRIGVTSVILMVDLYARIGALPPSMSIILNKLWMPWTTVQTMHTPFFKEILGNTRQVPPIHHVTFQVECTIKSWN